MLIFSITKIGFQRLQIFAQTDNEFIIKVKLIKFEISYFNKKQFSCF